MVLLEAMAAKTPIVASDIEGYRTVVNHQVQGLLTPPKDPAALADAIIYLLQRPDLCRLMGAAGHATASRYSWDRVADLVLDYYHHVLHMKQKGARVWNSRAEPENTPSYHSNLRVRGKAGLKHADRIDATMESRHHQSHS
jgi:hypothetical protein